MLPKIVIAIDSFKGSLSSLEAAQSIENGLRRVLPQVEISKIPVADGGEGTIESLVAATKGKLITSEVHDPLLRPIKTDFGLSGDGQTAFIEVFKTAGLTLVEPHLRNPLKATSFGVGEQIIQAYSLGVRNFIICLGGSAVTDGGSGMLAALGARFYSEHKELKPLPEELIEVTHLDLSDLHPLVKECTFSVACDVDNPLIGPKGAAFTFGPQKGASLADCQILDQMLTKLGHLYEKEASIPLLSVPKTGAAGGLGAAFMAFFAAKLVSGINLVLDFLDFDSAIIGADLIITGEGSLDSQSLSGKTPIGIVNRVKETKIPVIALAGSVAVLPTVFLHAGFLAVFSIAPGPISLEYSIQNAAELLAFQAENLANIFFNKFSNDS